MFGSQAEYARHAGLSRQAVNKMVRTGKIPVQANGQIDFAAADQARSANSDPARDMPGDRDEPIESPRPRQQGDGDGGLSFTRARTAREAYQARLAQLEYERKTGRLIERAAVTDALHEAGRAIRRELDGVMLMADELDAAARKGGVQAVRSLLRQRLRELEESTADRLDRLRLDRASDDTNGLDLADDGDVDPTYG